MLHVCAGARAEVFFLCGILGRRRKAATQARCPRPMRAAARSPTSCTGVHGNGAVRSPGARSQTLESTLEGNGTSGRSR